MKKPQRPGQLRSGTRYVFFNLSLCCIFSFSTVTCLVSSLFPISIAVTSIIISSIITIATVIIIAIITYIPLIRFPSFTNIDTRHTPPPRRISFSRLLRCVAVTLSFFRPASRSRPIISDNGFYADVLSLFIAAIYRYRRPAIKSEQDGSALTSLAHHLKDSR